MKLEYVASAIGHTRIVNYNAFKDPTVLTIIRRFSSEIQNQYNHVYSVLFNAYTERKMVDQIDPFFKDAMDRIFTDSGGLQMVTLGHSITPELKKEIYKFQSQHCDVAMGFDEIPVISYNDKRKIKTKQINKEFLLTCAKKTRENLDEQLQTFIDTDSRARAVAILQGTCREDYYVWHDILFNNLSSDKRQKLAGLAIGFPAFGKNLKESLEICRVLKGLDTELSYVHLLGVGAIPRLLPFIILIKSGFFEGRITRISYDTTSHTLNSSYGRYYLKDNENIKMTGRWAESKDPLFNRVWDDFEKNMKSYLYWINNEFGLDFCRETLYYFNTRQTEFEDWGKGKGIKKIHFGILGFIYAFSQILNLTKHINELLENPILLKQTILKLSPELIPLLQIKSLDDFDYWYNHHHFSLNKQKGIEENIADINIF